MNSGKKYFPAFVGLIALSAFFNVELRAQDYIDLVRIQGNYAPQANFPESENETDINDYNLDLNLPLPITDSLAFVSGLTFDHSSVHLDSSLNQRINIYSVGLKLGLNKKLSKSKSLTVIALPKFAGDVGGFSTDDFQIGLYGLYKLKNELGNSWSIGLYANSDRFGPFLVPLVGWYHLSADKKWEINATLPVWANVERRLSDTWSAGLSFAALVRSFHLNRSEEEFYLERRSNDVMLYLQWKAHPSILIQSKIGYSIGREFEVYDNDDRVDLGLSLFRFGDEREFFNTDPLDGYFVQLRFIYRYGL